MTDYTDSTSALGISADGFLPLEWDDEKVSALWSFYAATESGNYFSARFGKALIEDVDSLLPGRGLVADYGCGSGGVTRILAQKRPVLAVDFPQTLASTRKLIEGACLPNPVIFSSPDTVPDHQGKVSALFFLEAVEHLLPHWVTPTFANLHQLLEPGGLIICSTPNQEDVARAMVCCPNCRHYFHKYQHMRTFSAESLAAFMESQGFETLEVRERNFGMTSLYARARQMLRQLRGGARYPHLLYIGRKP